MPITSHESLVTGLPLPLTVLPMTHCTRVVVPVTVASNTGFRIHTSVDPVLSEIIPAVRHQVTVRLIAVPDAGFESSFGGVTIHAERIAMAAVAKILLLRGIGSVPGKKSARMVEGAIGF